MVEKLHLHISFMCKQHVSQPSGFLSLSSLHAPPVALDGPTGRASYQGTGHTQTGRDTTRGAACISGQPYVGAETLQTAPFAAPREVGQIPWNLSGEKPAADVNA